MAWEPPSSASRAWSTAGVPSGFFSIIPDLVSRCDGGHSRPYRFDDAGHVMPGDGRKRYQVGVVAATDLVVQRIDRGRMDPHQYLSRLRHRFGHFAQLEGFRTAKRLEYYSGPITVSRGGGCDG